MFNWFNGLVSMEVTMSKQFSDLPVVCEYCKVPMVYDHDTLTIYDEDGEVIRHLTGVDWLKALPEAQALGVITNMGLVANDTFRWGYNRGRSSVEHELSEALKPLANLLKG